MLKFLILMMLLGKLKMNLATKLTVLRIILVPFFMLFMFNDNIYTRVFALFIFVICVLTDAFDGVIARKQKTVTKFGIFLDPIADKLIISAALISFVGLRELRIPAWMVVFIISREFIITGLRLISNSEGEVIPADKIGKFKTTSQTTAIIIILLILILNTYFAEFVKMNASHYFIAQPGFLKFIGFIIIHGPYWIMFVITALTVYSGISYIYKYRHIFKKQVQQ